MKIPKTNKIHNKSTKPIPIWTDWYPKNNPNPSNFRNPKFGEITNHKTNLEVGCGGANSRNGMCGSVCGGVELWWEEDEMDLGFRCLVLQVWENIVYSCLRIVSLIELWLCVLECIDFPLNYDVAFIHWWCKTGLLRSSWLKLSSKYKKDIRIFSTSLIHMQSIIHIWGWIFAYFIRFKKMVSNFTYIHMIGLV